MKAFLEAKRKAAQAVVLTTTVPEKMEEVKKVDEPTHDIIINAEYTIYIGATAPI